MDILENIKSILKFLGNNRFSLDDIRTLRIELKDKIVFTVNEKTSSEKKITLESLNMKIHIEPTEQS
jgi:hypothetical protein